MPFATCQPLGVDLLYTAILTDSLSIKSPKLFNYINLPDPITTIGFAKGSGIIKTSDTKGRKLFILQPNRLRRQIQCSSSQVGVCGGASNDVLCRLYI
jgi:hypothetical protein